MSLDPSPRVRFEDADVVRAYRHRPAYPPALLDFLIERAPGRARALDLGCGTGKLSIPLARHFARVDAVDPSRAMLAALATGAPANLSWTCCDAEDFTLEGAYDLVTAGASVHWMDAEQRSQ